MDATLIVFFSLIYLDLNYIEVMMTLLYFTYFTGKILFVMIKYSILV